MNKSVSTIILSALIVALPFPMVSAYGADKNSVNTNPVAKVSTGEQALKDFEKIKKINNDLAIRHFTGVLQKNPKDANAYAKRGRAYSANKDYVKALPDLDKAIELDPKLADAYVGRAVIRLMKKDYDACWQDVHKAESLGGAFWPSFMEALQKESGRKK